MRPWNQQWFDDCEHWHKKLLGGRYRHWCNDWDGFPVDETTPEFDCCTCFHCKCGTLMKTVTLEGPLHIHDDIFECPKLRIWNFWKHDYWEHDFEGNRI